MATVVHQRGSVGELHALDPFAGGPVGPQVWWCDPTDAAIVLGSRQGPDLVDQASCERLGLKIVVRRSGGGAVVIRPDAVVWIDLVVPHGVAPDDVRGAMVWAGEHWQQAIEATVGPDASPGRLRVHRGGLVATAWSELVCFAGTGPGELLAPTGKLVGLSQRRTRHGLRLQGMAHLRSLGPDAVAVLRPPGGVPPVAPVEPAVAAWLDAGALADALARRIAT